MNLDALKSTRRLVFFAGVLGAIAAGFKYVPTVISTIDEYFYPYHYTADTAPTDMGDGTPTFYHSASLPPGLHLSEKKHKN